MPETLSEFTGTTFPSCGAIDLCPFRFVVKPERKRQVVGYTNQTKSFPFFRFPFTFLLGRNKLQRGGIDAIA